ncbi:hypothetical protein [Streptomyces sp. NRRL S-448]|uniref:hypothetical protein n=1 Tax=Streptomyces sp. NRRL S-448 TaxID=1463907 RepID=UPI0035671926
MREFIGEGSILFHSRPVTAGLAVRIQVWESGQGIRDFGESLATVSNTTQESNLIIATAANVATATVALVERAALELGKAVGRALQAASDDYVDFYEGYYPASSSWSARQETYRGADSEITLSLFS